MSLMKAPQSTDDELYARLKTLGDESPHEAIFATHERITIRYELLLRGRPTRLPVVTEMNLVDFVCDSLRWSSASRAAFHECLAKHGIAEPTITLHNGAPVRAAK